jgi:hypothetical protein
VSFTATVSGSGATPHGAVNFYSGSTLLGSAGLSSAKATFATTALTAGTDSVTAVYSGDASYSGSTSSPLSQLVNKATLNVTANNKSRQYGLPDPAFDGVITGLVNDDNITANYTDPGVTLTSIPGSYSIEPTSFNDPNNRLPNYSPSLFNGMLTITKASPTIVLAAQNPAIVRIKAQPISVTGILQQQGSTPSGTVDFVLDGVTVASAVPLVNGSATISLGYQLTIGAHSVVINYSGDSDFNAGSNAFMLQRSPKPR